MELFGLAAVFVMLQHSHRLIWPLRLQVLDQIAGQINGIDIFIFYPELDCIILIIGIQMLEIILKEGCREFSLLFFR